MKKSYTDLKHGALLLLGFSLFVSCKRNHGRLGADEGALVKDSVTAMAANIERDISHKGPAAWLNYFEDRPEFYMANEGQLVFRDYQSAKVFILNTVVKRIPRLTLRWSHLRIDALNSRLAAVSADFHEDQALSDGKSLSVDGYFTGLAHNAGHSWKLRNCHWSVKAPGKAVDKERQENKMQESR